MARGRKPKICLNIAIDGRYFKAKYRDKFIDDLVFYSQFRCAEHIMNLTGKDNWYPLKRLYSVVAVTIDA